MACLLPLLIFVVALLTIFLRCYFFSKIKGDLIETDSIFVFFSGCIVCTPICRLATFFIKRPSSKLLLSLLNPKCRSGQNEVALFFQKTAYHFPIFPFSYSKHNTLIKYFL